MNKIRKLPYFNLICALFALYLAITYWPAVAHLGTTVLRAARPLLVGGVIAYIVNLLLRQAEPGLRRILPERGQGLARPLAIATAYLLISLIFFLVAHWVVPELVNCVHLLFSGRSHDFNQFVNWFQNNGLFHQLWQQADFSKVNWTKVENYLAGGFSGTFKAVMSTASRAVGIVTTTVVAIFFSVYLLIFKDRLAHQVRTLITTYLPRQAPRIFRITGVFNRTFANYIGGQCKDALLLGGTCFLGMLVLRLPYAAMIGAVTVVTALIPIIGAILGAGVGVVVIFAISPVKALIFFIFIILLQQFDNRVTYPLIVGKSIGLPSLWVFVAVMIGGGLAGIFGMLFTVPFFAACYQLLGADIRRRQQK